MFSARVRVWGRRANSRPEGSAHGLSSAISTPTDPAVLDIRMVIVKVEVNTWRVL